MQSLTKTHCPASATLTSCVAEVPQPEHDAVTVKLPQAVAPAVSNPVELIDAPLPVTVHLTLLGHPVAVYCALLFLVIVSEPAMVRISSGLHLTNPNCFHALQKGHCHLYLFYHPTLARPTACKKTKLQLPYSQELLLLNLNYFLSYHFSILLL